MTVLNETSGHVQQTLSFGEAVKLDLLCLANRGYLWHWEQAGEGKVERLVHSTLPGPALVFDREVREQWEFRPLEPGRVILTLCNRRPWNEEVAHRLTLDVEILSP